MRLLTKLLFICLVLSVSLLVLVVYMTYYTFVPVTSPAQPPDWAREQDI